MNDVTAPHPAVGAYLETLDSLLRDLPRARRLEIVEEIREHINEALAAPDLAAGEAAVRNVLERLGEPGEIADEARQRFDVPAQKVPGRDWAIAPLLAVGFFAVPFIGWFAGVALLWISKSFRVSEKILGTTVLPFGVAFPLILGGFVTSSSSQSCMDLPDGSEVCEAEVVSGFSLSPVAGWVVGIVLVLAPLAVAVYLHLRLVRLRRALEG